MNKKIKSGTKNISPKRAIGSKPQPTQATKKGQVSLERKEPQRANQRVEPKRSLNTIQVNPLQQSQTVRKSEPLHSTSFSNF